MTTLFGTGLPVAALVLAYAAPFLVAKLAARGWLSGLHDKLNG